MKPSEIIKNKLISENGVVKINLKKSNMSKKDYFTVTLEENGVIVDNLGNQPYLSFYIFDGLIEFLINCNGELKKGNVMNFKLGSDELPIKSVEGYVAYTFFDKEKDDWVFRRSTPICAILEWAGICENKRGYIALK